MMTGRHTLSDLFVNRLFLEIIMRSRYLFIALFLLTLGCDLIAQRPGGPPPRTGGMPPPDGRPPMGGQKNGPENRPDGGWVLPLDTNNNGNLEPEEFAAALQRTFVEIDRNANGSIESTEAVKPIGPEGPRNEGNGRPDPNGKRILPPFFFLDRIQGNDAVISRAEFERIARTVFAEMDKNGDGTLIQDESRHLPPRPGDQRPPPQAQPNARFIAAELRFGDKLVKGQPFSAETVIEDTKRLFDGTTATKRRSGAIYRDGEGRTRREQPLEMVGGVNIVGSDNKPQMLVFINDFGARSQIFLDIPGKVARKTPLPNGIGPFEPRGPENAKVESIGTKTIEGVTVEGTRESFEIPVGQIGNDKPMLVLIEKWFSKELQILVQSRHIDPVAGEHVFKLVNIKRAEPAADLFAVPSGYRVEAGGPERGPGKE